MKALAMNVAAACAFLAMTACSPSVQPPAKSAEGAGNTPGVAQAEPQAPTCTSEPRLDERDTRPRCAGMATAAAPQAYRIVGGSGDPVDQTVCNIDEVFVLDGKMFGVEFSGGIDGTYRFVRTPNIPGLSWTAGGRYHIEFPEGAAKPGTLTTEGGGTTTAGATSRKTVGGERFTLTPVEACTP